MKQPNNNFSVPLSFYEGGMFASPAAASEKSVNKTGTVPGNENKDDAGLKENVANISFYKGTLAKLICEKDSFRFLDVNNVAIELYGYSKEEFLNLSIFDIICEDNKNILTQRKINSFSGDLRSNTVKHLKKNRKTIFVDFDIFPVNYKGKEALLIIENDTTKVLQLQKKIVKEKAQKQIEIAGIVLDTKQNERTELGKELHDNINQILATAKLYLDSVFANPDKKKEFIDKSRSLINLGIQEIRKLSRSMVAPSLGAQSLKDALQELMLPLKLTKKSICLKTEELNESKLSDGLKLSVYRIAQEQLNNIIKYAEASEIIITISQTPDQFNLQVADNGKGFDVNKNYGGIGLTNIRNRASAYEGKVMIDSFPGNGCRVNVNFKLPNDNKKKVFYVNRTGMQHVIA